MGVALGYGSSPKFGGYPKILLQRLGLATLNLARSWNLPRPIIKSQAEERVDVVLGQWISPKFWGSTAIFTQWLNLGTSNLVHSLGLPKPTIKPHPEEKWTWPSVRKLLYIWGFPLIFLQRPRCPLSASGASCLSLQCSLREDQYTDHKCAMRRQSEVTELHPYLG